MGKPDLLLQLLLGDGQMVGTVTDGIAAEAAADVVGKVSLFLCYQIAYPRMVSKSLGLYSNEEIVSNSLYDVISLDYAILDNGMSNGMSGPEL